MTNSVRRIYEQDGTFIDRPFNEEESLQALKDKAETDAVIEANAQAAAKRQALLDKLGISEEEARLLLG